MKKYRRRRYFINRGFQGRFILWFVAVSLAGSLIPVLVLNFLAMRKLDTLLYSMKIPSIRAGSLLAEETLIANAAAAVVISVVFLITLRGINRFILGPNSIILAHVRKMAQGDLVSRIMLPEDGEMAELGHDINSMAENLNSRFADLRKRTERISKLSQEMKWAGPVQAAEAKEKLLTETLIFREKLSDFRL